MVQLLKFLHGYYDNNCVSSLFTFKDTITRGHTANIRNFFTVRVSNLWNSLPGYVLELPSVNSFKNRLDNYCQLKGIKFNTDIDFDIFTLSSLRGCK